jgi:parallel beta-helix repeat protein
MAGIEVADWQNDCTIRNNQVVGTHLGSYGIYFGGGLAPSTNCLILNNVVDGADGNGIMVDSPGIGEKGITSGAIIQGNTVRNSNENGILIGLAAGVVVSGNTCENNSRRSTVGDGIHVQGRVLSSRYVVVFGNRCFDSGVPPLQRYGIFLDVVSNGWVCANTLGPNTLVPERIGPLYVGTATNRVTVTP